MSCTRLLKDLYFDELKDLGAANDQRQRTAKAVSKAQDQPSRPAYESVAKARAHRLAKSFDRGQGESSRRSTGGAGMGSSKRRRSIRRGSSNSARLVLSSSLSTSDDALRYAGRTRRRLREGTRTKRRHHERRVQRSQSLVDEFGTRLAEASVNIDARDD